MAPLNLPSPLSSPPPKSTKKNAFAGRGACAFAERPCSFGCSFSLHKVECEAWMGNACHCVVKGNLYRSNHKLTCSYSLQAVPPKVDCFVSRIRYHEQITSKSERRAGLATGRPQSRKTLSNLFCAKNLLRNFTAPVAWARDVGACTRAFYVSCAL